MTEFDYMLTNESLKDKLRNKERIIANLQARIESLETENKSLRDRLNIATFLAVKRSESSI